MVNKTNKYYCLKITSILNLIFFVTIFLLIATSKTSTLNSIFKISLLINSWKFYGLKIFLILLFLLFLAASILWVAISFKNEWTLAIKDNLFFSFLLAVLTLNFYSCFFIVKIFRQNKKFNQRKKWFKFKMMVGFKQWFTIDYVLIAFFCALVLIFSYLEENILPRVPFGGGIGLKFLPLLIISFATSFLSGFLTGFISAIMSLLFIPANNIISPWSFILDYFLPMISPAIVAFFPFKSNTNKSIFTFLNYFFPCFLVFLLIYFWQFLSGYFLWISVFPNNIWIGYNAILYSAVYNFIHIFIFTYPIIQMILPIIYRSVGSFKR